VRRWITICNAFRQIQFVDKPYWPTKYDSNFIVHYAMKINSFFSGITMIEDNHFRKTTLYFK
jgi:hypothetical protein